MPRLRIAILLSLALIGSTSALADDPPKSSPPAKAEDPLKPLPPVAIPDDPPPHEGAMIDFPITIEPPDIITVEVLEALPGQPISGEHLVRPDGTISLGFYGDVHVRGLTIRQAKVKVLLHLRQSILDHALGLVVSLGGEAEIESEPDMPMPPDSPPERRPDPARNPFDLIPNVVNPPGSLPEIVPPAGTQPDAEAKPPAKPEGRAASSISRKDRLRRDRVRTRRARAVAQQTIGRPVAEQELEPPTPTPPAKQDNRPQVPDDQPLAEYFRKLPLQVPEGWKQFQLKDPADSTRVFVDITSHNTKVYYVQGDVGVPGRLPFTGKETVLDALNYAGGLVPTAEPTDIHLYRPARGGKPTKDYRIELDAILKGVKTANLQLFPDDRLIIGRNPIVKKTVEIDRAAALINAQMSTMLQYGFTARTFGTVSNPPASGGPADQVRVNGQNIPLNVANAPALTAAQRDAMIKDWAEFLWSISSKEGGALLDEKAFKEAWMKKLTPAPAPGPKQ